MASLSGPKKLRPIRVFGLALGTGTGDWDIRRHVGMVYSPCQRDLKIHSQCTVCQCFRLVASIIYIYNVTVYRVYIYIYVILHVGIHLALNMFLNHILYQWLYLGLERPLQDHSGLRLDEQPFLAWLVWQAPVEFHDNHHKFFHANYGAMVDWWDRNLSGNNVWNMSCFILGAKI